MDGLFVVIAIIIAVLNLSQKMKRNQKQNQNETHENMKRKPSTMNHNPVRQWLEQLEQLEKQEKAVKDVKIPWGEGEGKDIKDRSRAGSLDYKEQSNNTEGFGNEYTFHIDQEKQAKEIIPKEKPIREKAIEEDYMFDLTEENLLRSVVMAEILGPPRAMKRRIR